LARQRRTDGYARESLLLVVSWSASLSGE
jgi:hypothetical protein